jgi:tetratricopeptide (TPR) repeat protein
MPGGGGQFAGHPQAEQLAAMQQSGVPQASSWTQKVTGAFTGKPANARSGPGRPAGRSDLDPISLGFASGPPNAELYLSMAKMSDQGGNAAHARSMYQRALTVQPNNLEGMLALGRLEDREGELDAALHYYLQAVKLHPNSANALNDLSLCYARRGQMEAAVAPLEQAVRLEPSKQLYRNNIAKVLTELNQIQKAVQHLSAVHPAAVAQYNMGVLLHQRGRNEEAVQFLTMATQADPNLAVAQNLLVELTGGGQQFAADPSAPTSVAASSAVLPTPRILPGQPYPSTQTPDAYPNFQTVPAETAQAPLNRSPVLLPGVQ